jgi:pantoate--beta-alanine ligase
MIELFDDPREAQRWCAEQRAGGASLGFVPTMGALHAGHLRLVRRAVLENDRACVSVFVNPLQFDDPRDLARYPRDLDGDTEKLDGTGAAMVFTGTLAGFFPGELGADGSFPRAALRDPGPGALGLEGDFRPGHFAGVATIVARLFELVRPARAYFGLKDFQQCLVVQQLARQLGYPEIVLCATEREPSGLARSSRNELLAGEDRERAAAISRALAAARERWNAGELPVAEIEQRIRAEIEAAGLAVEYAAIRDPDDWSAGRPAEPRGLAVALVAARLGGVRLIDNLLFFREDV